MSTEESLREIAILGAGKIGRGVAGLLFSRAGYRLHLYHLQGYHPELLHRLLHIHLGSESCLALFLSELLLCPVQPEHV